MKKKTLWIIIVGIIVIIALLALGSVFKKDEGLKVAVEKVEARTIIESVNASGKVYPETEVKVSPDISGEIVELNYEEGDSVRKGAVLARIYADIYSTQRNQAAAAVDMERANVANTRAQLPGLKSAVELAQRAYDRQKQLVAEKVISASEFEQAENSLRSAQANYNAALQNVKRGEASIQGAQANLAKADKDLGRTAVVAPRDGVISLMSVKRGERVVGAGMMAGTEMMRIADMSVIEVQVDVSENDIPKVKLGDSALVEVDAYTNRKFKGLVTKIASSNTTAASTTATTSNDVTNYKVHIRLLADSYSDLTANGTRFPFRPGMNASADIQTTTKNNVISAAINAVTTRKKGSDDVADNKNEDKKEEEGLQETVKAGLTSDLDEVVYVLQKDNSVKKVKVTTGIQDMNHIEILSGLKAGDSVVTAPYNVVSKLLKTGTKVKVVPADKLFEAKK
ncbi:efflux RND transporter periplasmic adaptor subunit [Pseudoflavitalea rhizosphaerae]|uniref:efflux RND transporter periplasmic adaptor subunit n=1 Tax=Pseudoflavitalea rhizosphaerae TaxID=1884793 RepID=UPI000F8E25DB|nr:efflux RND transporter periplasmic adaptor subunit [Pseudoflavitalea rhizosphaerae]